MDEFIGIDVGIDRLDGPIILRLSVEEIMEKYREIRRKAEEVGIMDTFVPAISYVSCEHDDRHIRVVDPNVPGGYKLIGILKEDGHIVWEKGSEQVQYVVNVDPDTGEQNIVAVIRDSLPKIGGRTVPSDAPSIGGQSKDMSPMLSKSHKGKHDAD